MEAIGVLLCSLVLCTGTGTGTDAHTFIYASGNDSNANF